MARKKAEEKPERRPTGVVRVDADIARMASLIATATGEDVADVLSPILRGPLRKRYAEVIQGLAEEVKEDPE